MLPTGYSAQCGEEAWGLEERNQERPERERLRQETHL